MENQSLQRSLSLLTSPLSLLAMGLLFLNDHFLRIFYPSWITGKLGDLAWLYFCPFALAAIFSLAVNKVSRTPANLPLFAAVGVIGLVFGAANLFPGVAAWLADRAGNALGTPLRITSDPTDLAALPALGLAGWQWIRWKPGGNFSPTQRVGWIVLAGFLTLANSVQPDFGITCLIEEPDRLVAGSNYSQYYASSDGGLGWMEIPPEDSYSCDAFQPWEGELALPGSELVALRSSEEDKLELTRDGGKTWQSVTEGQQFTQAEIAWVQRTSRMFYRPGPQDAVVDPGSGNLVFAMGLEGVLVVEPGGSWISVPVGEYGPVSLTVAMIPFLLQYELMLGAALALLLIITPGIFQGKSIFQKIWLSLNWAGGLFSLLVLQPARQSGYGTMMGAAATYFTSVSVLILVVVYLVEGWKILKPRLSRVLLVTLLSWMAFTLPLVLWALNLIPVYTWAAVLAVLAGSGVLVSYYRSFPAPEQSPD